MIGLAVPACGYFGAKRGNKGLMGCFTCCNCVGLVAYIVLLSFYIYVLQYLDDNYDQWCPDGATDEQPNFGNNASSVTVNGEPLTCDNLSNIDEGLHSVRVYFEVVFAI